jgi:hypothetical protein
LVGDTTQNHVSVPNDVGEGGDRLILDVRARCRFDEEVGECPVIWREQHCAVDLDGRDCPLDTVQIIRLIEPLVILPHRAG